MNDEKLLPTREEILGRMWTLANASAADAVRVACFPEEEWEDGKQLKLDAVTEFKRGANGVIELRFVDRGRLLERLLDAEEARMDLISVNGRAYALNICSMGIDARIGVEVARYKRIPGVSGHGAYNLSTVVNLLKGISRPAEVECGGKVYPGKKTLVCVCNGQYYGGGFNPVPDARPDDGLLDVLIIKDVSLLTAARVIGKYKHGQYAQLPQYITHCRVPEVTIRCQEESVINLDGECLRAKEATFTVLPGALRFFYPRGLQL